ncbi:LOW QUALITY PROTEIN: spidroin-2-like [Uloborus diversus]|uniref:LOW QUALITY PROTEIN: spidroin-2-like n=1 Tax=Uloborus diversus TaxID=327109 RepID=UPI00240A5F28|nr:LOW QUALITY PROTEIN: spidroin-2-like [Uloborus diversus]
MLRVWCGLLLMGALAHAAAPAASSSTSTKREDPSPGSGGSSGGQPVYSPSASSNSYSSAAFDASEAANAYKAQQQSQGNLYYYYYPVQEKGQDNAYASSSTHNYATAPANGNPYESQDSTQNSYHAAQASDAYTSQDAAYAGALNQLSQYGLANGYSLGTGGLNAASGLAGANAFGAYGAVPAAGYAAAAMPGAYGAGSYPAGSAAVANYAPQSSTLAQYAAQLTGYGGGAAGQYGGASGFMPQGYGTPSRRLGLGSLIMPMLALAGLTMLVPTITSNLGSRNKRSTDSQKHPLSLITEYKDKLEKYYSLYRTAVEKEECMNRIICEFGTAVSDVKGKGAVVLVLEKLVPKHMRPKMNVFKAGALSTEIGKCKKLFKC